MTRTAAAAVGIGFGLAQYAVAVAAGFVLLPAVMAHVDPGTYGRWLLAVDLLGYAALADLGVGAVLPWLVAAADGRGHRAAVRRLTTDAAALAVAAVGVYAVAAGGLAWFAPPTAADPALTAAVLLLAAGLPVGFVGRVFTGTLAGLQDAWFLGGLALAQSAAGVALTLGLLAAGAGPLALAAAAVGPMLLGAVGGGVRLAVRHPDLLRPGRPTAAGLRRLTVEAFGGWLGGVGARLTLASAAVWLTAAGCPPADVVRFVCTAKLGEMVTQQTWLVLDGGLVGLAQLHGAGRAERVREVVAAMLRLGLVGAGGAAVLVLAVNPGFVRLWLGADAFAGTGVNAALAAGVVAHTLTHALAVTASTLGRRLEVGVVGVVQGAIHAAVAVAVGARAGPVGVAAGGAVVAILVGLPLLSRALGRGVGEPGWTPAADAVREWLPRAVAPLWAAATVALTGFADTPAGPAVGLGLAAGYGWAMRPLLAGLPLPPRVAVLARRLRLLPRVAP